MNIWDNCEILKDWEAKISLEAGFKKFARVL
jgi:hypothetical protein